MVQQNDRTQIIKINIQIGDVQNGKYTIQTIMSEVWRANLKWKRSMCGE